jgi:hypothetical protein
MLSLDRECVTEGSFKLATSPSLADCAGNADIEDNSGNSEDGFATASRRKGDWEPFRWRRFSSFNCSRCAEGASMVSVIPDNCGGGISTSNAGSSDGFPRLPLRPRPNVTTWHTSCYDTHNKHPPPNVLVTDARDLGCACTSCSFATSFRRAMDERGFARLRCFLAT